MSKRMYFMENKKVIIKRKIGRALASCNLYETNCGGICVNLQNDMNNCGECGINCTGTQYCCGCDGCRNFLSDTNSDCGCEHINCTSVVQAVCCSGNCCNPPMTCCPPDVLHTKNHCVNLQTNSQDCRTCGNVCPLGQICVSGTCIRA